MTITLITCTYNAESVLKGTLDSVLQQTSADIEHIIIDGKSKDATLDIAEKYRSESEAKHANRRIIIQSEPDKGLYDAMNKGIQRATGDYLCFLNAGDKLSSETTIAEIIECLHEYEERQERTKNGEGKGVSCLYGETDIVDEDGKFLRHRRLQAPEHLTWRSFRHGMLVCHQSFYANTSIAKMTPYNLKYKISADVDWCIRIMKEGERQGMETLNTHRILCHYLAGGMSVKNHRASLIERFKTMKEHYGVLDTIMLHIWFVIRSVFYK